MNGVTPLRSLRQGYVQPSPQPGDFPPKTKRGNSRFDGLVDQKMCPLEEYGSSGMISKKHEAL